MDDFMIASLQESKNEWCARLINILTPLIMEGFRSIHNESAKLCADNDEADKVLMTFQNLITRVPKWNGSIIKAECERIISRSNCNYLEDLISCVHVIQLKVLTCVRVGSAQKKIDINVPKLEDFIHSCYIHCARKIYSNVYLYDTGVHSLQIQKYKRETEVIIQECILNSIRDSLPIEDILRNYMDETTEDDVVETIEEEKIKSAAPAPISEVAGVADVGTVYGTGTETETGTGTGTHNVKDEIAKAIRIQTDDVGSGPETGSGSELVGGGGGISFNNSDEVLTGTDEKTTVNVPKTIEHLNQIRAEREALDAQMGGGSGGGDDEDDEDDEDYIPRLTIGDASVNLDDLDVHTVNDRVRIEPDVILDDIQILS